MTDNKLVKGDICIYHYADGNGSVNIVEVVEVINSDLSKIKCIQVICDNSGNSWFEYMLKKSNTMTASNEYLHKIDFINRQKAEISVKNKLLQKAEKIIETERAKAIKVFAERLCEDRVSNDPVVIAVKVELKEMVGEG